MTNEEFKFLYHGWVTSKDPAKAAKQRAREKEYNAEYYQKHKEKWSTLRTGPKVKYDKPIGPKNKVSNEYLAELAYNSKKNSYGVSKDEAREMFSKTIPVPDQKPFILKNPLARGIGKAMDSFAESYSIGLNIIKETAKKTIDSGKKFISDIKDDIKFAKELYTYGREKLNAGKSVIRSIMNKE